MKKLLLWDIDGTLLTLSGLGRDTSNQAFQKLYGRGKTIAGREMAGKTDLQILEMFFERNNIQYKDLLDESLKVKEVYFNFLKEALKKSDKPVIYPAVKEVLKKYHNKPNYVNALLTGNYKISAQLKLEFFDLWSYFEFGAFGDYTTKRDELIPVALDEFKNLYEKEIDSSHIFVIGDTPHDIAICKPYKINSIAVATGGFTLTNLEHYNPTFSIKNLLDFPNI